MKFRPQIFILRKNIIIIFFYFHEIQAPDFHPVDVFYCIIFINLRPRFLSCTRILSFNFHKSQTPVFILHKNLII